MKPRIVKLTALQGNEDRYWAYVAALHLAARAFDAFGAMIALRADEDIPEFLELVAKAWAEKPSKFNLTPTGENIIKAHHAAYLIAGRTGNGFDPLVTPALLEIKTQFAVLFGRKPPENRRHWIAALEEKKVIPSDQTFRKTLKRLKLSYH